MASTHPAYVYKNLKNDYECNIKNILKQTLILLNDMKTGYIYEELDREKVRYKEGLPQK